MLVAAPGARLDRYELLCPLAQGGMAAVWAARLRGKHGFEKTVAVKMIRDEYASDPRFQQMFLDEAHIAAGIEHVNVAQILDLGEHKGVLYLVMELVDGEPITRLMRVAEKNGQQIPVPIACRIVADACGGLHAAHELRDREGHVLGVVHRDVSPQNILVTARGVPKLIDFGVAKARDRMSEDTNAGTIKGKVSYMAPEQISGKDLDRRADVWAIGAVLHHVLSGAPPFDAGNAPATLRKLMGTDPPALLPDRVPAAIGAVIMRALERDPDVRYPTAAAFRADLESAMAASGMTATTDDVAAYCTEQLAEREAQRRSSLVAALSAATERAKGRPASIPPPRGDYSLEDSIARMSPSERATLAVKLAGGLGPEPSDGESAARLLVALGASLRTPSGMSESGIRGAPESVSSGGAAIMASSPAEPRSRGGVLAVAIVAILAVAAVFGARRYLLVDSAPANPQPAVTTPAQPTAVAPPVATEPPTTATTAAASAAPVVPVTASQTAEPKKAPLYDAKKKAGASAKPGVSGSPEAPRVDDGF